MGMPSSGVASVWRNKIEDIRRLLTTRHHNAFMIFNLSENKYDYSMFDDQILDFPFPDHHAPPLALMFTIVNAVDSWIQASPEHVAVVHCKGGKGRTGLIIVAWLMYSGLYPTLDSAARVFATKRSSIGKGVTQPSQVRYLTYFSRVLLNGRSPARRYFKLQALLAGPLPRSLNMHIDVLLYNAEDTTLLVSCDVHDPRVTATPVDGDPDRLVYRIPANVVVFDDVLIRGSIPSSGKSKGSPSPSPVAAGTAPTATPQPAAAAAASSTVKRKKVFHAVINTSFIRDVDHVSSLCYSELDDVRKGVPADFCVKCELAVHKPDPTSSTDKPADTSLLYPFIDKMCNTFAARVDKGQLQPPAVASFASTPTPPSTPTQPHPQQLQQPAAGTPTMHPAAPANSRAAEALQQVDQLIDDFLCSLP